MRTIELKPIYVEFMPEKKEEGVLYISKKFSLSIHLCACGCKTETVIPIRGNDIECSEIHGPWQYTEKDGRVTLRPSIGNFAGENPYHAHYFITDNKIEWCN